MNHSTWRDAILDDFVPQLNRLTLAADPDGLLAEEGLQETLQKRGFEVVEFQDPVAFRYLYESSIRPRWEAGEPVELVVLLRSSNPDWNQLPYDLLRDGRRLSFSLSELFPKFTYNEVAALEHSDLDALFQAQAKAKPGPGNLGENATRDFILRQVFGISFELIKSEADLLARLAAPTHHRPPTACPFATRLVHHLQQQNGLAEWPLEALLSDPAALYEFLQERWPYFLDQEAGQHETSMHEPILAQTYDLKWPGPLQLPFGQPDIRAFVDTLFLEGRLRPVVHPLSDRLKDLWVAVGLKHDPAAEYQQRLSHLQEKLAGRVGKTSARHQDWFSFAAAWAEVNVLRHEPDHQPDQQSEEQFQALQAAVDSAFQAWLDQRYKFLATMPPHPPVMVHHIARSLNRQVTPQSSDKVALVVLDGMAFDQWFIVRDSLAEQIPDIRFQEGAVFAWIPTVTSVSRQAIFAGSLPLYFPGSISTTAKEANLWSVFWENRGLPPTAIDYSKALRTAADMAKVEQILARPKLRVIGLVVDQIDHMLHGMTLGLAGLHQQLRLWLSQGFLTELFQRLWQDGYRIYLTSDHGNVAGQGIGNPGEQSLADIRGQRVRIYPNQILRDAVHKSYPNTVAWPADGLPPDFFPLLAPDRQAFVPVGTTTISHGGQLLEEVIVPYVRLERRKT
jgi:hypothetical protein